jgi:WD40 repeat protein
MAIKVSMPHVGSLPIEAEGTRPLRFQAGGTLRRDSVYVERPADEDLPEALARGEFCYVLTTRQMGKSSLCVRTMERLRKQGLACTSIDLTGIGSQDSQPTDWYYGLMSEIAMQLELEPPDAFWDTNKNIGPVHAFSRYLEDHVLAKVTARVVIFIDEIDSTLALPFSRDDFFAAIRALYNRRAEHVENERLTFCLLGVAAPGDLIADPARTPFNIGRAIRLDDFKRQEMEGFRGALAALGGTEVQDLSKILDEIFAWTGGHPYMTQRVCEDLIGTPRGRSVDEVVRTRFLVRGRIDDGNLQYAEKCFGDRHDSRRKHARRMLHLYSRLLDREAVPVDAGEPVQLALQLTGMAAERDITSGTRVLIVRNRVFREVFDTAWVRSMEGERAMAEPLARWLAVNRSDEAVPTGQALADLQQWAEGRDDLTPDEQMFLRACIRADARRRELVARQRGQRILILVLTVAVLLLSGSLIGIWLQSSRAEKARIVAEEARIVAERNGAASEVQRRSLLADSMVTPQSGVRRLLIALEAVRMGRQADEALLPAAENALGSAVRSWVDNVPLAGHVSALTTAEFSPDGTRVVTASSDNTARIWDLDGSGDVVELRGHLGDVRSAMFSPDGTRVVTASSDGTVRIWYSDRSGDAIVLPGNGAMTSARFSMDGTQILTASSKCQVQIWKIDETGKAALHYAFYLRSLLSALPGDSGKMLMMAASLDGEFGRWLSDGSEIPMDRRSYIASNPRSVSFSPDGMLAVTVLGNGTARVWKTDGSRVSEKACSTESNELERRHGLRVFPEQDKAKCLNGEWVLGDYGAGIITASFSLDGLRVVTGGSDKAARIWDADGQGSAIVLRGHQGGIWTASFSPDGKYVVTASDDGTARVWKADGGDALLVLEHEKEVRSARFSPDGRYVVTASADGTARIWRADGGRVAEVLLKHDQDVVKAIFSPDRTRVATVSASGVVRIWPIDGSAEPVVLSGIGSAIAVSFSGDGARVMAASDSRRVKIWQSDGTEEAYLELYEDSHPPRSKGVRLVGIPARSADFSRDGTLVAMRFEDDTIRVWQTIGGEEVAFLRGLERHIYEGELRRSVRFSPDGTMVVTTFADNTARVWRADGGDASVLRGHQEDVTIASFSPDSSWVVTASADRTARVWRVYGNRSVIVLRGHTDVVTGADFGPDSQRVMTVSKDGSARVWQLGAGEPTVAILRHADEVLHASFSPDGERIVTASTDKTARVWRANGKASGLILHHDAAVLSASFSPDGTHVVTASQDGTARVWLVDIHSLEQLACAYAGRNLTRAEWSFYFPGTGYQRTCDRWPEDPSLANH